MGEQSTTQAPILEDLNQDVILAAMERARESLTERRRFEYEAWLNGKSIVQKLHLAQFSFLTKKKYYFVSASIIK